MSLMPRSRGPSLRVARLPVEKWQYGWRGLESDLLSWYNLHVSLWRFFLFSESTAWSSLSKVEERKRGAMKN